MSIRVPALRPVVQPVVHGALCGGGDAAASSTLLDGLVSWWSMDEASGTRVDSHGSNDLTDNNTVGSTTGKVGNAARFVSANNERLTLPSSPVDVSTSHTLAAWIKQTTSALQVVMGIGQTAPGWNLQKRSADELWIESMGVNTLSNTSPAPVGSWTFVAVVYDAANSELTVFADTVQVAQLTSLTISSGTPGLTLGSRLSDTIYDFDGDIDEAALWSRALTADELDELYNSGSGIGYPG